MADQLGLDLDDQPRAERTGVLESFHVRAHMSAEEALAGERKARGQDARILAVFVNAVPGMRMTASRVELALVDYGPPPTPLLTSIRRALTNLTRRGLLVHYPADRRPGPRGARESTWGLADRTQE